MQQLFSNLHPLLVSLRSLTLLSSQDQLLFVHAWATETSAKQHTTCKTMKDKWYLLSDDYSRAIHQFVLSSSDKTATATVPQDTSSSHSCSHKWFAQQNVLSKLCKQSSLQTSKVHGLTDLTELLAVQEVCACNRSKPPQVWQRTLWA